MQLLVYTTFMLDWKLQLLIAVVPRVQWLDPLWKMLSFWLRIFGGKARLPNSSHRPLSVFVVECRCIRTVCTLETNRKVYYIVGPSGIIIDVL